MQAIKDIRRAWTHLGQRNDNLAYLPFWRQVLEMGALYLVRGIGPGYYLQARWWRPSIPFADKWEHLNKKEYNAFIDRWNAPGYQKSSQHKIIEKAVLQLLGVPTPEFIGFLHRQRGACADGAPLRLPADLERLCHGLVGRKICFKLVEGYGGAGFAAFRVEEADGRPVFVHPVTGEATGISDWWALAQQKNDGGYIVEHYLTQHPVLSDIHANSVNTLRIWLYQARGEVKVAGAFLRVGRKGSLVDNTSSGGLYCPVDLETGVLAYAANAANPLQTMNSHPDTGGRISGVQLPFWRECKDIAGRALQAFPKVNIAGVDVAIGVDGPRMIELNVRPDQIGCARINLPLKRVDRWMRASRA
ncbi:sugar-transfer associated ATP-grasp domain-containing protein [Massilia niastensis]|uniref:sugar-transfer associated ATP-grasp domain-containing protein n=1 Tax=Massilia niastensis TaxID=544911 RepID=UPI00036ED6D7|nr:sugar-transfer associated ATP-grasp domain-containing protein [Massilia niastensis]